MMSENLVGSLYKNHHHNCLHVTVSGILLRDNVRIDYLWGQAGFKIEEHELFTLVTAYHTQWTEYLEKYHGVIWNQHYFNEPKEYVTEVKKLLKHKKSVGVELDLYALPYCIHYEKLHDFHAIEIVDMQEDKFVVCDHYFQYHGYLEIKHFCNALYSCMNYFQNSQPKLFYYNTENHFLKKYKQSDLEKEVTDNVKVMKGILISSPNKGTQAVYLGVKAFPVLIEKFKSIFSLPLQEAKPLLIPQYYGIKEIADSRFNFGEVLKKYAQDSIANEYQILANSWAIVANLLLRAHESENHAEYFHRIQKRLENLFIQEMETLNKLEEMIK